MEVAAATLREGPHGWRRYRVILYFLLGLAALDTVIASQAPLWRTYDPHYYRERLETCRRQPWDLVMTGGSTVLYGLDERVVTGVRWRGQLLQHVNNLGLPLGTAAEVCEAVEHGLTTPPRLLIYGITASDLNEDRVEPQGPQYLMDAGDVVRWIRLRPEAATWCCRHMVKERLARLWNLYYYRKGIQLWLAEQAERCWPGCCPEAAFDALAARNFSEAAQSESGFLHRPPNIKRLDLLKASGAPPLFPYLDQFEIKNYPVYVNAILDWADNHRVPLLLLDMPVPEDLDEHLCRREYSLYRAKLAELARERGVPVLRPTRAQVGLTDADFCDLVHLNSVGAARLSAWLRQYLAEQ